MLFVTKENGEEGNIVLHVSTYTDNIYKSVDTYTDVSVYASTYTDTDNTQIYVHIH